MEPSRSTTSRRLYSDAEIERLRLLRRATLGGRRIGDVARIPTAEIEALVEEDRRSPTPVAAPPTNPGTSDRARSHRAACLKAAREASEVALETSLSRAAAHLGIPQLVEQVLVPVLQELGDGWQQGRLRIYHEHLATAVVRSFLDRVRSSLPSIEDAPVLVVTTPSGQHHELGALTVAALAAADGWRAVYLGSDMPATEIVDAATRRGACVVAVSLSLATCPDALLREIALLRSLLPAEVDLVAGGRAAGAIADDLLRLGVLCPASLDELRVVLGRSASLRRAIAARADGI